MAHNTDSFLARLDSGKSWSLVYGKQGLQGLVEVWKYGDAIILTWEECPDGEVYDEAQYTRDERFEFASSDDLLDFLRHNGLALSEFKP